MRTSLEMIISTIRIHIYRLLLTDIHFYGNNSQGLKYILEIIGVFINASTTDKLAPIENFNNINVIYYEKKNVEKYLYPQSR